MISLLDYFSALLCDISLVVAPMTLLNKPLNPVKNFELAPPPVFEFSLKLSLLFINPSFSGLLSSTYYYFTLSVLLS